MMGLCKTVNIMFIISPGATGITFVLLVFKDHGLS